jgi:asparagine synthase (glutamine-hydrolysing)
MGFVGLRWTPGSRDEARAARALANRLVGDWTTLMDRRGFILLHRGAVPVETLPHETGFVFGERFGRLEPDPSPPCADRVDPTPGWINERWGPYLAVLIDRGFDIVRVLRDPSGAHPCFLTGLNGVGVFFSEAHDFIALAPDIEPDLGFVRAFLRYPPHVGRRTGLAGVEELAPGECAIYPRSGFEIQACWTPHRYAQTNTRLDWDDGKAALRCAAETCIASRSSRHRRIALRLSGGFDSSVMLGLLRRSSGADIVCVNEYWEGAPEGDEREQARAVAAENGVELIEFHFDPRQVDYARALRAPLTVKPTLSILGLGNPDVAAFYQDLACSLLTSGQGGDHLFHRSRTAWIAADALRDGLASKALFRIAIDTARLTGNPVWDVLAAIAIGAARWKTRFQHRSEVMGVLVDGDAGEEAPADHAWLQDLRWSAPARSLRVHQLLHALSYFDEATLPGGDSTQPLFLSQPIIETCLRIPPYVMTQGGKERALARAAFADLVSDPVRHRVTKGETTRYFTAVLAANRDWIRSVLVGGRLVDAGVVDRGRMEAALSGGWLQDGMATDGLYALIASECWLRNLAEARVRAATALAA